MQRFLIQKDTSLPADLVRAERPARLPTVLTHHVLNRGGLAVRSPLDE